MKLSKLLHNKYFIVLILAGLWIVCLDSYNLIAQYRVANKINSLERDIVHYQKAIQSVDYQFERIHTNPKELERIAREKYFMKRTNEDVFIIVEK